MSTALDLPFPAQDRGRLATPLARIGLIIPSSNRLAEPQFHHYAPADLGVHVTRVRMSGKWKRSLDELTLDIVKAASVLADAKPDLIVFHCTGTSMQEGPDGNARLLDAIRRATGIETLSTADAIAEALRALQMRKLVLISPYAQATNDHEIEYLNALGFDIVRDVALGLAGSDDYIKVPPERWVSIAVENARDDADGVFLSCTNTTQIEAIPEIERRLGKPVVNSNQAALWVCLNRLRPVLGGDHRLPEAGRLMHTGEGVRSGHADVHGGDTKMRQSG